MSKVVNYGLIILTKSAFEIFDSEGTLNEERVSGQDGSLGNTLN